MNKTDVTTAIAEYEYWKNGFRHLSGTDVRVVNVQMKKDEAIADVILRAGEDEPTERYNGCHYPYNLLKV